MSDLTIALITIFGTVASVSGVVLFVFNGTKALIREMHKGQQKIQEGQQKIQEGQQKIQEGQQKMEEMAEQRHREIVELLKQNQELMKMGFTEVLKHRAT